MTSNLGAMRCQIKSQFKVALLQLPRSVRSMKVEDFYYDDSNQQALGPPDLTLECAKVAVSVSNSITKEVETTVKNGSKTKGKKGTKKSSILAQGPPTSGTRKSTRKRMAPSWTGEAPLASSTLTAAALGGFGSASTSGSRMQIHPQTPIGNVSLAPPMITPKFNPATPLHRSAMRTQKSDEKFLISMNGSPVYVGAGGRGNRSSKNDNMIPLPIGGGKTLMVPADNPEVQPLVQKLISSCLKNATNK